MAYKSVPSKSGGAMPWFLQRVTGVVLLFVMIGHYLLMHYNIDSGHTYSAVLERMQNPFYKGLQMTFVVLGIYHGINGTWSIIRDFELKKGLSWTLYAMLVISGVVFGLIGITTLLSL